MRYSVMLLKEQQDVLERFNRAFHNQKKKRIVIYGTGINAEALVKYAKDYQIIGLMDAMKTGSILWDLPVFSYEEVLKAEVDFIVIVARPSVHAVIYTRIAAFVQENKIPVYDIDGKDVSRLAENREKENGYFMVSKELLLEEIEKYDAVSFDIFDTLLMRKVLYPTDVFEIMEKEEKLQEKFCFAAERILAEKEILKEGNNPTIYDIYERIGEKWCLDKGERMSLLEKELEYENKVLVVRQEMLNIFQHCIRMKKNIFLVSDMYLTSNQLKTILREKGICGYEKLIVSCEYGCSKREGLFAILKKELKGLNCLHIGDNRQADIESAKKHGINAFYVMSGREMLECSLHDKLFTEITSLEHRIFLGLYMARAFNNPFILYHSKGEVPVFGKNVGYLFIAPLLFGFVSWLSEETKQQGVDKILFGARDGYLIQKLYKLCHRYWNRTECDHDYILISRRNASMCAIENENDINDMIKAYQGEKSQCAKEVFGVSSLEIEKIKIRAGKEKKYYLEYLRPLLKKERIAFFDFMSKGTCHLKLEKILKRPLTGLYFQKSESLDEERNHLKFASFCDVRSAFEKDYAVFKYCDFLEAVVTDFNPSFFGYDEEGNTLFYPEKRSDEHLTWVKEMQESVQEYTKDFLEIYPYPVNLEYAFYDKIFGMIDPIYSKIDSNYKKLQMYDGYSDKQIDIGELFKQMEN